MDKETLSNYGWIVICVLVLAVMIALATPFGTFVADAVKATTAGFFSVNQNAMGAAGITIPGQEFESCEHEYEITSSTVNCDTGGSTTHTCKLCGKSYTETKPAGHTFDNASDTTCDICNTKFTAYAFVASDYDAKMGTTTASDAHVVIPETFEHNGTAYKVTSIGNRAFNGCQNMESIVIPDSVTSIETYAFQNCTSLEHVDIPDGVISIGNYAFFLCKSLTSVAIPNSVTNIGDSSFSHCTNLASIILPKEVSEFKSCAFYNCTALKSITFLSTNLTIKNDAFSGCNFDVVNYAGTEEQWNNVTIPSGNGNLSSVTVNYNYTGE